MNFVSDNVFHISNIPRGWKVDGRCYNMTVKEEGASDIAEIIDYQLEEAAKEWQDMYNDEEEWKNLEAGVILYNISAFVNSAGVNCAIITYGRLKRKKEDKNL